ncbi:MAG: ABC transporter permease [Kineosporiaceae bacterium]
MRTDLPQNGKRIRDRILAPGRDLSHRLNHQLSHRLPHRRPDRHRGRGLFGSELVTMFRRRRTLAILAVLAGVPVLLGVVIKTIAEPTPGEGPPMLDRVTQNGLFLGVTSLIMSTSLFLPLAVGVVAGDSVAGESGLGTLRYLLVAPAGRTRLLAVKAVSAMVFCAAAPLTVVLAGTVVALALFPIGPVTLLSGDTVGVPESIVRTLLVAGYVAVSMLGLAAIGVFISTVTDVPVGAMAATVSLAIIAQILDGIPQLTWLHPWLFSHWWLSMGDLLRTPIAWSSFASNALLQGGYLLVFGSAAWARFTTRDVLS